MTYKAPKTAKDLMEFHKGPRSLTRRELMAHGLATGILSVATHDLLLGHFANAAPANCPAPVRAKGAIAQIFAEGGPTMGARFISDQQMAQMNPTMAFNYGISGTNLVKLGPNMVIDSTSPFGATLLQGPPGYAGGAAAWRTNVLSRISGGGHLGQFNQDDGAGQNTGLLGGVSPFKVSEMGKDLKIGNSVTPAPWANGLPGATISRNNLTFNSFANTFSLNPPAAGLTNSAALEAASNASNSLQAALSPLFKTNERKGASALTQSAACAFYGNSALADPNYGATLFNPASTANANAFANKVTLAQLSGAENALLGAYYQSAMGVAGGVVMQMNGRDYHNQNIANNITPADVEEARAIVMFLAACDAAQAPGAMLYFSNGQAIAQGVQSVNANIGGTNVTVNGPNAQGDAGGAYNAGLAIFYHPTQAPGNTRFTGTVDANGNARIDNNVSTTREAVAGLYLSALKFVGANTAVAEAAMKSAGVSSNISSLMVV